MKEAIEEFYNYTNPYLDIDFMMHLKQDHTIRVKDLSERIGKSINLDEEDLHIAKLIGLLHDIGRFEQWKRYSSFSDAKTVDHASLGVEILKKDNYIRKYIKEDKYDKTILDAIEYHNKVGIKEDITGKDRMFAELIRDADKIDILYLYTIKDIVIKSENEKFSDHIFANLKKKQLINRGDLKTKADRFAISLGFVFDLNFRESFKILKETKYMDKIIDIQAEMNSNPEYHKQLEEIRIIINNYIEEKLTC